MRNSESSFKWIIGTLIAFLAAGSGTVALLNYIGSSQQPPSLPISSVNTSNTSNGNPNSPSNTGDNSNPSDTCIQGYVWREAVSNDHVCVTPETRAQAQDDNNQAQSRIDPNGAYGPDSCIQGYVWREAVSNDHVCVTPETRAQAQDDNNQAQSRVVHGG